MARVCSSVGARAWGGGGALAIRSVNRNGLLMFDAYHGTATPLLFSLTRSRTRANTSSRLSPPVAIISANDSPKAP